SYANVYRELEQTIRLSDAQEDLRWFRSTSGPGMPMNWPQFEVRLGAMRGTAFAWASIWGCGTSSVTATPPSPLPSSVSSHDRGQTYSAEWSDDEGSNSFNTSEANGGTNPFDEESAGKGVRVRALYDYDGQEQDELSFKAGDELTKLGEEDEQGWCKGRLDNGQLGLYPANYVEAI
ncbi:PACN1 protein, partial [Mystacornis crossleyi]|nr:PACN1 protein [Mystacornis crossleyi]